MGRAQIIFNYTFCHSNCLSSLILAFFDLWKSMTERQIGLFVHVTYSSK